MPTEPAGLPDVDEPKESQRLPSMGLPAKELPAKELPAKELPAKELPAKELPTKGLPANEFSSHGFSPGTLAMKARVGPRVPVPLYQSRVECGFPSPAADTIDGELDLNEHVIRDKAATYFVRASGHSMRGVGIFDGDILVVDRSEQATDGSIVVAAIGGDMAVKRLVKRKDEWWLCPEADGYEPIRVDTSLTIWGVVSFVIHNLK